LPGTPAYRAGVLSGDVIMEVEGESTEGYTVEDAVKKLKGKAGEEVTIGVMHKGSDSIEQIKLVREVIQVATVLGDRYLANGTWDFMLDDDSKIGYVRLTHFSRRTGEELRDAMEQLQSKGMKGLVLDLRFNPGGLLSEAVEVCDLFLEKGTIVSTKGRNVPERSWEAHAPGTYSGFPMAVLVNRYSASASEIVSACLQDNDRAVVVGERSWGKGSVQNVIDLGGGASALKLTTASYLRPNGHNIHRFPDSKEEDEWGVKPNEGLTVRFSDEEMRDYLIGRRKRDVIGNGDGERPTDRQLDAALSYLREKLDDKDSRGAEAKEAPKSSRADVLTFTVLPT
jgi:carboxyl-terminal processing protease